MKTKIHTSLIAVLTATALFAVQPAQARRGAKLGTPQRAGSFQVTLTTLPVAPQSGSNRFRVDVSRKGEPVRDAEVRLTLTMPLHRHGGRSDIEPRISRRLPLVDGAYAGQARLPMGGVWQAQVDVKSSAGKGTAYYRFMVGKAAPVHLGMAHPAGDFVVSLTTIPAAPRQGENRILVKVEREGKPLSGATVAVSFHHVMMPMPQGKVDFALKAVERETKAKDPSNPHVVMREHNVKVALKAVTAPTPDAPALAGQYAGAVALPLPGDWEAIVSVDHGAAKGSALYQFRVGK